MSEDDASRELSTRAVHAGREVDYGPSVPAGGTLDPSTVWYLPDLDALDGLYQPGSAGYYYASKRSPNGDVLASAIADLEGGEAGVVTASGMSALLALLLATTSSGHRVLVAADAYGGTRDLLNNTMRRFGLDVVAVDTRDLEGIRAALTNECRWLIVESISNPLTRIVDIAALRRIVEGSNCRILCDNTFATPCVLRPLEHGAHVVWHSTSKFLNGHHDMMGGALVGDASTIDAAAGEVTRAGLVASPWASWLCLRGLRTLGARMERICLSAIAVASALDEMESCFERLHFPLLDDHPDHELARRLLVRGAGGMMSFEVRGGLDRARRFVENLRLVHLATSLGGVQTTISHPVFSSHRAIPAEERTRLGINDGLIRLSIGLESPRDIINDLRQALEKSAS